MYKMTMFSGKEYYINEETYETIKRFICEDKENIKFKNGLINTKRIETIILNGDKTLINI